MAKRNPGNPSGVKHKAAKSKKPQKVQLCIFCGGDANRKTHAAFCQAPREAPPAVELPPVQDEPYTNRGKGEVLTNDSVTSQVAALFKAKPFRESSELNELVGWQFSQAVYALRQRGWRIQTLRLAPRRFAYQLLVTSQETQLV